PTSVEDASVHDVEPPELEPLSAGPGAADSITADPDIVEIFLEESTEVAQTLEEFLPRWEADPSDSEALVTVRRSFHTLKGSGRIVGAARIGEFAWSVENLLNRVIEGRVQATSEVRETVRSAFDQLPALVSELRDNATDVVDLAPIVERAEALAAGHEAPLLATQTNQITEQLKALAAELPPATPQLPQAPRAPTLIEVFCDEAAGHLEVLRALAQLARNHDEALGLQPALRACHTLHGSANAASLTDIAQVCGGLEELLISLSSSDPQTPIPLGDAAVALIEDCNEALFAAVKRLRASADAAVELGDLENKSALLARISVLSASIPLEPSPFDTESPTDDDDDEFEDLDQVFFEEAREILEANDHIIERWRESHRDLGIVEQLQRQLHTLKGGARLAGMTQIGDLSHALESLLYMVCEGLSPVGDRLIELIERAQDRLRLMLTQGRSGLDISDPDDLIARIDGFVSPGVEGGEPSTFQPPATVSLDVDRDAGDRQRVQVGAELLDELSSFAGEISIAQNRTERYVGQFKQNLDEMEQTVQRLHDQLRRLEIETESQILFRQHEARENSPGEFDPLELDRFSTVQELSRALAESVADLTSIQAFLEELTRDSESILAEQNRACTDLQHGLMQTRMLPFSQHVPRFRRIVRQIAHELGKQVELEVNGAETRLDRNILDRMLAPLEHMVRNALDHGIETPHERRRGEKSDTGQLTVSLTREVNEVVIRVSDDGRGLDRDAIRHRAIARGLLAESAAISDDELFQFVLEPSFSTADEVTQISGRGVGMDVVNTEIKQLGGSLHIDSEADLGTRFTIRLPFTLAINQALLVVVGADTLAIPLLNVEGVMRLTTEELQEVERTGNPTCSYSGFNYPMARLG
nr:Hpt domain-containing protein [Gammaproteobacteria bacterium]